MTTQLSSLRFTQSHEWIRVEGAIGYVGISDHAQHEITDVVYVELPAIGREVTRTGEAATVESVKAAFSIYAPVSGSIADVNKALESDPGLINRSPYEKGWLFSIKMTDPSEVKLLMDSAAYDAFVKNGGGH